MPGREGSEDTLLLFVGNPRTDIFFRMENDSPGKRVNQTKPTDRIGELGKQGGPPGAWSLELSESAERGLRRNWQKMYLFGLKWNQIDFQN